YSRIRHPMYTGFFLFSLGQMLLLTNWIVGVLPIFCMAGIYFTRINKEEELMLKTFGDRYRNYINQTGRLFPKW
ncbi:isoprenylcysteine carboxylmethyltransferase family protein, partial [Caldithrix abyssi]|nr:isoprenylcysteine carboxylmethyltransferase family protein [Caldithrix abyssi]